MKGRIAKMAWYWIVLIVLAALWVLTMLIYWFSLDNKLIYNVVRPMLEKKTTTSKSAMCGCKSANSSLPRRGAVCAFLTLMGVNGNS